MVREARFELAQDCSRQPLKLVRLPFRHSRKELYLHHIISVFRYDALTYGSCAPLKYIYQRTYIRLQGHKIR